MEARYKVEHFVTSFNVERRHSELCKQILARACD